jgi:hypothetical protein
MKTEDKKIQKYEGLTMKIHFLWNIKAKVIPVIIGETRTTSKSFRQYLSNVPRKLQKRNTVLSTRTAESTIVKV